jgi:tetratricopeptide (TPR) repeat protein
MFRFIVFPQRLAGRILILAGLIVATTGGVHATASAPGVAADQDGSKLLAHEIATRLTAGPETATKKKIEQALSRLERRASSDSWLALGHILVTHVRESQDMSFARLIEKTYEQAYRLDSTSADALAGMAWAAAACHRFDDTVTWATLALEKDPEQAEAHAVLGDAAVELGRYELACHHYQKMLDLRPDLGSHSRGAHLLYLTGQTADAFRLMETALKMAGGRGEARAWCIKEYASMLTREGRASDALSLIREARQTDARNPLLIAAEGLTRMANGDLNAADELLREYLTLALPTHEVLVALHDLARARNDFEMSDRYAARVYQLHRELSDQGVLGGEGQLARFLADRGDRLEEAVQLAAREYSHHKTQYAADTLAWAYYRFGDVNNAAKLVPAVLKYRAADPSVHYHVGLIQAAAGEHASAREHLAEALRRGPHFNPVHAATAARKLAELEQVQLLSSR